MALSDPMRVLASGAGTIENTPGLVAAIASIALEERVVLIVVGMPYAPDGGRGGKAEEVGRFVDALRGAVSVPVETWDESFTSVNARQAFIDGGMKKKQRRQKGRVDEMAARLLLQEYLENAHQR
jgi:putative Holliday junction resolvase